MSIKISSLFFLFIVVVSCSQKPTSTFNYSSLKFDTTKVAIFNWDSTLIDFLPYSEPLALTDEDVRLVDSLFNNAVEYFNQTESKSLYENFQRAVPLENFIIDMSKYKRQYFPYKDVNGEKFVYIICFCRQFPEWRYRKYFNTRLHGGMSELSLKINLSSKKAGEISSIGGYG